MWWVLTSILIISDSRRRRNLNLTFRGVIGATEMAIMKIALEQQWENIRCLKIQGIWQEDCCKCRIINMGRLGSTASKVFLAFCYWEGRSFSCILLCAASVLKLLFYLWKTRFSWTGGTVECPVCKQRPVALLWHPNKVLVDHKESFQRRRVAWASPGALNSAPLLGDTVQNSAQAEMNSSSKMS